MSHSHTPSLLDIMNSFQAGEAAAAVLEAVTLPVFVVTTAGVIVQANEAACAICSVAGGSLIGLYLWEAKCWAPAKDIREILERGLGEASKGERGQEEFTVTKSSGELIAIKSYFSPLKNTAGVVTAVVACVGESPSLKQEEQGLERINKWVSETHHRVKNSLQLVSSLVNLKSLERGEDRELKLLGMHIRSLASLHDLLSRQSLETSGEVSARHLLEMLLETMKAALPKCSLQYEVEEANLTERQAATIALALNEIMSSFPAGADISIIFAVNDKEGVLRITSSRPAAISENKTEANIILALVERDLRGRLDFGEGSNRMRAIQLHFPLAQPS